MQKLKRAVIKEELVALTGDFKKAIVLNQMIYWAERVQDFDKFIEDEKKRAQMAMGADEREYAEKLEEVDLMTHGWVYKAAEELSEETMMNVSKSTMSSYLNELVKKGWLDRRKNPKWKGDNTFQYRVNMVKIQQDLHKLGYSLEGYPLLTEVFENQTPTFDNRTSEFENQTGCSKIERVVRKSNNVTRDYNKEYNKDFVVVMNKALSKYEQLFGNPLTPNQVLGLFEESVKYNKDLIECMQRTKMYADLLKDVKKQKLENPIGALRYEIQVGWDLAPLIEELKKKPKPPEDFKPFDWVNGN